MKKYYGWLQNLSQILKDQGQYPKRNALNKNINFLGYFESRYEYSLPKPHRSAMSVYYTLGDVYPAG